MKILQMLPSLAYGDAVGNDTLAIFKALKGAGYTTAIYTDSVDPRIAGPGIYHYSQLPQLDEQDVLIFHMAISSELSAMLPSLPCKKILIYHNITPPEYFEQYHPKLFSECTDGRVELAEMRDVFDYAIADSSYNKNELVDLGFSCPIDVVPILIPLEEYARPADSSIIEEYRGPIQNILFVGRVAPNKKLVDLITTMHYYQKYYEKRSRLILVGDNAAIGAYTCQLREYADTLRMHDIVFTGKIPFAEILAFYKVADAFLCMSEHEGFCVPLVESMVFDLPVIAKGCAAIPETLGEGGIIMPADASPALAAATLNRLMTDSGLRQTVIARQRARLKDFSYDIVMSQLLQKLRPFLNP